MACQIQQSDRGLGPGGSRETREKGMLDNVKAAPTKVLGGVTGWFGNLRTFLGEVRNELKRVTWPSQKEVYATTVVVIVTSIFFGVYLWGLDQLFERGVLALFRFFGAK